jgi:hypothetical protein
MVRAPMIRLTDEQLSHLFAAAQPLERDMRDAFLEAVADILGRLSDPGPGDIHRAIVAAQRKYFDPPLDTEINGLHTPKPRRDSLRRQVVAK